ncbi:MAG TPA: hypothetical protein VL443_12965 [Cyclobacteriaceae bacterium]|nr:hypothetical protein [Cyclobacteriaceae bacterium]
MKNLLLLLVGALCFACGSDDVKNAPGAPNWSGGYPSAVSGATTVDLNLQADKTSNVYWIMSDKALSLSVKEIRTQALKPTTSSIKFYGVTTVKANEAKTQTVTNLQQFTKYFTYIVAENKADTILEAKVNSFDFKTAYRQDTSFYQSSAENRKVLYLIYRPEEVLKYPKKTYPILFFLGGNGEVATDAKPINYFNGNRTLPEYIGKGNDVPMIVLTIQHTVKDWNVDLIDEGIVHGLATYPVDTKRVYLSGCSGGGFGCWNYSVAHADKLAAIVPISGGGNTNKACSLKNIPIWAFHNADDGTVNVSNSKNMIAAVNACSPTKEVKLTLFEDNDGKQHHDCWRRVFNKDDKDWSKTPDMARIDIYTWLLKKSK